VGTRRRPDVHVPYAMTLNESSQQTNARNAIVSRLVKSFRMTIRSRALRRFASARRARAAFDNFPP
jgi:hypothetical protein